MAPLGKIPLKPLGNARRRYALFVIALGLSILFLPMVILDSPVVKRTQWTPRDIAMNVYERSLPVPKGQLDEGLFEIGTLYVLMILALPAVFLPGPPKPLLVISTIGLALSYVAKYWDMTFLWTFGWNYWAPGILWGPGHMKRGYTWWVLPWIMPALVAICLTKLAGCGRRVVPPEALSQANAASVGVLECQCCFRNEYLTYALPHLPRVLHWLGEAKNSPPPPLQGARCAVASLRLCPVPIPSPTAHFLARLQVS
jgi:hypothetical protein